MGSLRKLLLKITTQEINKIMYNHNTEPLIFCCTHKRYLNFVEKLWWALSLSLLVIFGILTIDNTIYERISWEVSLPIFYIIFGIFIVLCVINSIQICCLAERIKRYSEAEEKCLLPK